MAENYGNSYNKIQQIVFFSCTNKQLFIQAYQMAHGLRNKNHELDFNIQATTEDVRENKKGKLTFKEEPKTEWERKGLKNHQLKTRKFRFEFRMLFRNPVRDFVCFGTKNLHKKR